MESIGEEKEEVCEGQVWKSHNDRVQKQEKNLETWNRGIKYASKKKYWHTLFFRNVIPNCCRKRQTNDVTALTGFCTVRQQKLSSPAENQHQGFCPSMKSPWG